MGAQKKGARAHLLASFLLAALATQAFLVSARTAPTTDKASQDDVKKPDCVPSLDPHSFPGHGGTTIPIPSHGGGSSSPSGSTTPSYGTPPSHSGSIPDPSHGSTTPSYGTPPSHSGSIPDPSHGSTTPSYGTPPSHSGSIPDPSHGSTTPSYVTPPSHSGSIPDPSHGSTTPSPSSPSHGHGGHGHGHGSSSSPSTGGGGYGSSPSSPSTGGGAYGGSPPSHDGGAYGGSSPAAPSTGGGAYGGSPPASGSTTTPSPTGHGTVVDPNSPGTCEYWRSHPMQIWSALGGSWPSSVGHFFGGGSGSGHGSGVSIQDALANTGTDSSSALLREATAALLNSMTRAGFPYTTSQVRDAFAAAAAGGSDGARTKQAEAFKKANEGSKA